MDSAPHLNPQETWAQVVANDGVEMVARWDCGARRSNSNTHCATPIRDWKGVAHAPWWRLRQELAGSGLVYSELFFEGLCHCDEATSE